MPWAPVDRGEHESWSRSVRHVGRTCVSSAARRGRAAQEDVERGVVGRGRPTPGGRGRGRRRRSGSGGRSVADLVDPDPTSPSSRSMVASMSASTWVTIDPMCARQRGAVPSTALSDVRQSRARSSTRVWRHDDAPMAPPPRSPHARNALVAPWLRGTRESCRDPTLATDDDPHQRHNAVTVAGTDHTGHEHASGREPPPPSRLLHRRSRHPRPPFQRARTHVPIRSCSAPRLPPDRSRQTTPNLGIKRGATANRHPHHPRKQQKSEIWRGSSDSPTSEPRGGFAV